MKKTVETQEKSVIVFEHKGEPVTTSRLIADKFQKRHANVLRDISKLECTPQFTRLNFELSSYIDPSGAKRKQYIITQDGFAFLIMGFTGYLAAKFKEEYINAFKEMRIKIHKSYELDRRIFELEKNVLENEKKAFRLRCQIAGMELQNSLTMMMA
jgi:Rha family phage regulatory protein